MKCSAPVPSRVTSRRALGRADVAGPLAVVLDAPGCALGRSYRDQPWCIGSPTRRMAGARWTRKPARHTPSTGARLQTHGDDVVLSVPVSHLGRHPIHVAGQHRRWRHPVIATEDATSAMRTVLADAAGADSPEFLPAVANGTATLTVDLAP